MAQPFVLQPGSEPIPGYRLIDRLGEGGFGEVWKAEQGGFPVALKFVKLESRAVKAEQRALEIVKNIHHPNLLTTFGAWQKEGYLILAMELAGKSLFERLKEARALGHIGIPREELLDLLHEAAKGLDYLNAPQHCLQGANNVGVQHRDIKPQNILLAGGSVKVADFGLARILHDSGTGHTGSMTFHYAAPEFFDGRTSSQSDQYSLGITYAELRGGKRPFQAETMQKLMMQHLHEPPDLSALPVEEHAAVARALAKKPHDRWPSCRAFIEALRVPQPVPRPADSDMRYAETLETPTPKINESQAHVETVRPNPAGRKTEADPPSKQPLVRLPAGGMAKPWQLAVLAVTALSLVAAFVVVLLPKGPPSTVVSKSTRMQLNLIPAGSFRMGAQPGEPESPGQTPLHDVTISKPFYLGIYEVTQEEYQKVMNENPSYFSPTGQGRELARKSNTLRMPMDSVTWDQAQEFCRELSRLDGCRYRLPTEAEWEYACRAGVKPPRWFSPGNELSNLDACFNWSYPVGTGIRKVTPPDLPAEVGKFKANAWGLFDMHGNVAEWCEDGYDESFYKQSGQAVDPLCLPDKPFRVIRGGSWASFGQSCRSACRGKGEPRTIDKTIGFRVVRVVDSKTP